MNQIKELIGNLNLDFFKKFLPKRGTCGCTSFSKANSFSLTLAICLIVFSIICTNYYFDNDYLKQKEILEKEKLKKEKINQEKAKQTDMEKEEMTHDVWMQN
ncbi:hypothetical protein PGO_140140 [Plasmodium gonderi]|uniref:Uncharacterized protein n=1 Tax=Plasmodium gonderi TaxID=77519 RepID=A0A1Y1JLX5_PLAGO|nr:hypothetical protein PGO_140140 [Plasmodium gonderi]GAW83220.1 hypothetical protein PGO_140140 [Plasmodium gonderi]